MRRRSFLMAVAPAVALSACTRRDSRATDNAARAKTAPPMPSVRPLPRPHTEAAGPDAGDDGGSEEPAGPRGEVAMDTWTMDGGGRVAVIVPAWIKETERLPLLVALHGRGEANKGPVEGVMGWPRDYALLRAISRVCAPPLTSDDLEGFVDPKRLAEHNRSLDERPFGGLVVACPYSPDVDLRKPAQIREYGEYLMRSVLPRVRRELPVIDAPRATGIDGVSLGGALALRIGLGNAESFGAVGSLQPAIGEDQIPELTELVKAARAKNSELDVRLLTSSHDYFKGAVRSTSSAWRAAGIEHEVVEVPGPHDYPFNRGPGAIEMLLWHDRTLART